VKIVYLHQYFNTPDMPGSIRSFTFANRLVEHGHDVYVLTTRRDKYQSKRKGITFEGRAKVIWLPVPYFNKMSILRRTISFFQFVYISLFYTLQIKPDLIFATSTPLTVAIPAIVAKKLFHCPMVFEVRDLWPELIIAMGAIKNKIIIKLMLLLENLSYTHANHIIALAPGIINGIMKYGVSSEKISFISNGCDLNIINDKIVDQQSSSKKKGKFIFAYTGAHGKANGLDLVLYSALFLKSIGNNKIEIILIGEGSEKRRLMTFANINNIKSVKFLDPIPKENLSSFFQNVDMGLQILAAVEAFQESTSPNKFFDYCSAGLPVLINYSGWISRLISENNMGWTVDDQNPESLANMMIKASELNVSELKKMGQNSRRLAESKFDRRKLSINFVKVIEKVSNQFIN